MPHRHTRGLRGLLPHLPDPRTAGSECEPLLQYEDSNQPPAGEEAEHEDLPQQESGVIDVQPAQSAPGPQAST
eukprot:CAMPEP_0202881830 /NCGR_PEP_ID=MMETSP1391-20130828/37124_1 /ASSEMBLY_ACC=CAM_ASM_000867 /TAXON_ID=1034604 /ORGANISM="Chlamydomonas leiostraca, Strain SAG 11-49" /LENGTH=72 /DNA_ID=CAMNT_0049564573 /DNA_START=29 /DNA_END=243 /DNA_ORIENTATION=+